MAIGSCWRGVEMKRLLAMHPPAGVCIPHMLTQLLGAVVLGLCQPLRLEGNLGFASVHCSL